MSDSGLLIQAYQHELLVRQQRAVLLCAHGHAITSVEHSALVLDDRSDDKFAMHRYRDYLGANNLLVVLNFSHSVHADALAALAGTVMSGGLLIVNLPQQESPFRQRMIRLAHFFDRVIDIQHDSALAAAYQQLSVLPKPHCAKPTFPNLAQQQIIRTMLAEPDATHVIMADRGRGKSSTLGAALKGYQGHARLIVTAPKRSQVDNLMQQAGGQVEFIAWERLIELPSDNIRLVIDEAAGLPIHILQQLCQRFTVWGIATTVEGYEGCGRGFVIRFLTWLKQQQPFHQHTLEQAVRWQAPDDCEDWLNLLLCLKPTAPTTSWPDGCHWLQANSLADEPLHQVIQLLLEAHYQSSPNDLRLLLDDKRQQLLVACQQGQLIGLVWIAEEGPIPLPLQPHIIAGTRRPAGDLLPQALTYKWQHHAPMQWRWWRIIRIAVAEPLRRQGLGSMLLEQVQHAAVENQIDAVGSSFGAAPEVLAFWQANDFQLLHQGQKRQMASGYQNAMVAFGCSASASEFITQRLLLNQP